jgi:hypothetical protein
MSKRDPSAVEALMAAMRATAARAPASVEIEGWGTVHVRPPTVAEVDSARLQTEPEGDGLELARGACRVICDADGARIFDAANADHVALLAAQPWSMLQRVIAAARGGGDHQPGN